VTIPIAGYGPESLNCTVLIFAPVWIVLGIPLFLGAPSNIESTPGLYIYKSWSNRQVRNPDPSTRDARGRLLLIVVPVLMFVPGQGVCQGLGAAIPST